MKMQSQENIEKHKPEYLAMFIDSSSWCHASQDYCDDYWYNPSADIVSKQLTVYWFLRGSRSCLCIPTEVLQSCLTLCDPIDSSQLGSSIHGILQAGILGWVVMPSSRGSSQSRDQTRISYISCIGRQLLLLLVPPGKAQKLLKIIQIWNQGNDNFGKCRTLLCLLGESQRA